jgi:hypothetical protein
VSRVRKQAALRGDLPDAVRTLLSELRALKEKAGYDLRTLERKTHASRSSWGRWLSGETWIPRGSASALTDLCGGDRHRLDLLWDLADEARRAKGCETPDRGGDVDPVTGPVAGPTADPTADPTAGPTAGSAVSAPRRSRRGLLVPGGIVMSAVAAAAVGVWIGTTLRSLPTSGHPAATSVASGLVAPSAPLTAKISGSEVIARANTWHPRSSTRVPYDQAGTYRGYRTDGSGYASMALGLPKPGPVSSLLAAAPYSRRIPMANLQPGDLVINPTGDAGARQVVIFERWADPDHSAYWAYQQRRGYGTDHLVLRDGLNGGSTFHACRPLNLRGEPSD